MAITKFIKRQDSGFKLSEGNSGESSLNLSNEIFELLCPETIEAGKEKKITFKMQYVLLFQSFLFIGVLLIPVLK